MPNDTELISQQAREFSNGQLANEIQRCRRGMVVAANKAAAARFVRRLRIMEQEANERMAAAVVSGDTKGGAQ